MTRQEFERLLEMALADGVLTEQEQMVIIQRAGEIGISPDELQVMIEAKQHEMKKKESAANAQAQNAQAQPKEKGFWAKLGDKVLDSFEEDKEDEKYKMADMSDKKRPTKCPHCGAPLKAFQSNCPSCGAEIDNDSSDFDMERFSTRLLNADLTEEKVNVIKYTPVPTSKRGILEFLTFANAQINSLSYKPADEYSMETYEDTLMMRDAWKAKVFEIENKAAIALRGDTAGNQEVMTLVHASKAVSNSYESGNTKFMIAKWGTVGLGVLMMLIGFAAKADVLGTLGLIIAIIGWLAVKRKFVYKFFKF